QARLDILLVTTVGDGRGQYAVDGLGGGTDVTDGDLVLAFLEDGPGLGYFLDQLLVDDEGDGTGVGQHPVAVGILGPGRNLFPGARLVGLGHALLHRDGTEGGAHVTDIGAGVVLLGIELGDLLGRTHVGIHVFETVQLVQIGPGVLPVGPAVGHADAVDFAFAAGGLFQCLQVLAGHGLVAQNNGRSQQ